MYNGKNLKFTLTCCILLTTLANVVSRSYIQTTDSSNNAIITTTSYLPNCAIKSCSVTCTGNMTGLNKYLESLKTCSSYALRISEGAFPDDKLHSNWLEGNFYLNLIEIKTSALRGIDNGAFNHKSVAGVLELELDGVKLQNLTEYTFVGLKAIETFGLINRIEKFSGDSFLKPIEATLKKVVIKHVTKTPTDPAPWLRGGKFLNLMTIVFDGSNFGGYINAATFEHLKGVCIIVLKSCKITDIADGTFDFIMKNFVLFVDLSNNQLRRVSGEYLTRVTSLKVVDLQNNPWECTCELENLMGEYKKNPQSFGENVRCSTPSLLAGKRLNEVEVEHCKDYKTTSVSTLIPTTLVTDESTEPSSTTEMEPSSSTFDDLEY